MHDERQTRDVDNHMCKIYSSLCYKMTKHFQYMQVYYNLGLTTPGDSKLHCLFIYLRGPPGLFSNTSPSDNYHQK